MTLYSAYDGKDMELKDVSSPKKIEDIIFENMRGTHLRYRNIYDDDFNSNFNPIRPNHEPGHYRRMEDLDDLELVDAKERKRQLREIRRQAKQSRNNPNYNSNYNAPYGSNDPYYDDYNSYNDYGGYDYDDYSRDRNYRESRAPRDNYNNQYDSRRRPDSHHHQYSGAIKDSYSRYSRNPDKYFANNYEEFHQNNLDAQRDYNDHIQGGNQYAKDYNQEAPKTEQKSKGLSRFNPFSSNKNDEDVYGNISDAEFDTTINQAMQDMGDNLKFKPSNDNRFRDNHNQSYGSRGYDRGYENGQGRNYDMNYDGYDDRFYDDFSDSHYNDNSQRFHDSRPLRDDYNNSNHYDNRHESFNQRDYRQNENFNDNYRGSNSRNPNYGSNSPHYDANHTRSYSGDGEIDYKYRSPRESRKRSGRNSSSHYDNYNHYRDESEGEASGKDKKNKTSDDLFEKHSRKFRR